MKREPVTPKDLVWQASAKVSPLLEGDEWFIARNAELFKLIGVEVLNLANRHGNIKPREVMKYFGIEE